MVSSMSSSRREPGDVSVRRRRLRGGSDDDAMLFEGGAERTKVLVLGRAANRVFTALGP